MFSYHLDRGFLVQMMVSRPEIFNCLFSCAFEETRGLPGGVNLWVAFPPDLVETAFWKTSHLEDLLNLQLATTFEYFTSSFAAGLSLVLQQSTFCWKPGVTVFAHMISD